MAKVKVRKRKAKKWIIIVGVFLVVLVLDSKLRPIVKAFSVYQAKSFATKVINQSIMDHAVDSEEFINLSYNDQNQVTGVVVDSAKLSQFKAAVVDEINTKIGSVERQKISVPVGTILGFQALQGVGPKINMYVQPASYVESEIKSTFSSAGINQTRHQLSLQIHVKLTAIIPGFISQTELVGNFPISECIIVGDTPQTYLTLQQAENQLAQKIREQISGS